jgi:protein-tyrosine phosphatase
VNDWEGADDGTLLAFLAGTIIACCLLAFCLMVTGCGLSPCVVRFVDSHSDGTPNLEKFAAGKAGGAAMWRMGQPPDERAWAALRLAVLADNPSARDIVVVKLNDSREGDDAPAAALGWTVLPHPLYPEDDKPWTVLVAPTRQEVDAAVEDILAAHARGATVLWHCSHGRDRTSLVAALVGRRLLGWSKAAGWNDMLAHGYRWELPGLDVYWAENGKRVR